MDIPRSLVAVHPDLVVAFSLPVSPEVGDAEKPAGRVSTPLAKGLPATSVHADSSRLSGTVMKQLRKMNTEKELIAGGSTMDHHAEGHPP